MNTAWTDPSALSVYELSELTSKSDRAADEHWLALCRRFIADSETNAAATDARDWLARIDESANTGANGPTPEERLTNWLSAGLPFRLAAPFRVGAFRLSSGQVYRFLRTLLYPAACEWVARDADRGLAEFITRELDGEKHISQASTTRDIPEDDPCALDVQTLASIGDGIFTTSAPIDPFEPELDLVERTTRGPSQFVSAVKHFDSAVSKLVASGRLESAKHRSALSKLRRDFRALAEEAFKRPADCEETGSILFYAACRALGWGDGESLDKFRAAAGALAGKVTELAGWSTPQTNRARRGRIRKNVKRYTDKFDVRLSAAAERLGFGDHKFTTEEAAIDHIVRALEWAVPTPLAISIAGQFVLYCEGDGDHLGEWPDSATGTDEVSIGGPAGFDWTVREQELSDLKAMAALICAVYLGSEDLPALIVAATCMIWHLKRKGVAIHPLQRAVLISLRRGGPATVGTLTARVAMFGENWTQKDVEDTLVELKAVRLNDGTVTALVHEASDGLWSTDARGPWEVSFGAIG
jgi:hypothetical protein